MAMKNTPFGKDRVIKSSEGFIEHALTGGSGPSNEIMHEKVDRPDQSINTAFAMDNVKLAMPIKSSIKDLSWRGSDSNLAHSLTGASTVKADGVGAAGSTKKTIIPNH